MDLEHEKRLAVVESRAKSNTHRLDKLEPIVEEIHQISETLVQITTEMKHTNKDLSEIKGKVDHFEQEPANKWKESTKALFNAMLGALGTALGAGIIYLLTMS